ncbi:uncharacterized protein LOC125056911 [Pieris napi]|uniref:uncharacterized protein LOC125056911 n=1 Tax=Pieris napi TaxID=78633 RepID=UPI001FB8ED54|nr:uncharacterized protein LOC125056911 [Pieris napi]
MSSSANSSIVWTYFKKLDARNVSCNLCGKNYKSSGNTTNLATHLKTKHHHAFAQLTIKKKTNIKTATHKAGENINNMSIAPPLSRPNTGLTGSNSFSDNQEGLVCQVNHQEEDSQSLENIPVFSRSPKLKQPTVLQLFEKSASYDDGGERHIAITQSLIYMIIKDNLPLSCVEKEGLQQFVHTACPRYKLPSRFKVTDLIEQRYSTTKAILVNHLQDTRYLTMSSDIVTITNSTRSFLIVTVHFLNVADASLNCCCLTAHYMTEGHSGEYIKDCFESIMSEFSIDKSKILNFSTDSGSNMIAAVTLFLGATKRIPCVAHTINLILDGVLKKK